MSDKKRINEKISDDHESYMEKINQIAVQWWYLAKLSVDKMNERDDFDLSTDH